MQDETPIMRPRVHNDAEAVKRPFRQVRVRASRVNAESAGGKRRGAGAERGREELAAVTERQQSAKEQLVYALRLTGAKLSEVQTKVRGTPEGRPAPEVRGNRIR